MGRLGRHSNWRQHQLGAGGAVHTRARAVVSNPRNSPAPPARRSEVRDDGHPPSQAALATEVAQQKLGAAGGQRTFLDVLLLGCFTHRIADEVRKVVVGLPKKLPAGSVRLVAWNAAVPSDACMVALYHYHQAMLRPDYGRWDIAAVPIIKHALNTFQDVHLKWRDVDSATRARFTSMLVTPEFPARA